MTTKTKTDTYVVRIDLDGRPFMRQYAEATSEADALTATQDHLTGDEVAAEAVLLQPLLDGIIARRAQGAKYSLSFKSEDEDEEDRPFGPVVVTDMDALRAEAEKQGAIREDGAIVLGVPFGTIPDYETRLPWMAKHEARRLAKYLGVPFGEA